MRIIEYRNEPRLSPSRTRYLGSQVLGLALPKGTLFHGTPVCPDIMGDLIKPHQATTNVNGVNIKHGAQPNISASTTLAFPVIRSLLHGDHPVLKERTFPFILYRKTNKTGQSFIFTATDVINLLQAEKACGYVYAAEKPPRSAKPFVRREDLAEWRVPEPMKWDWVAHTNTSDLPKDLLVVEDLGSTNRLFEELPKSPLHPLELAEHLGVSITSIIDLPDWS